MQLSFSPQSTRDTLSNALIVTRREVRDTLRDWRLVVPILALTLIFPGLMTFVAERMLTFLAAYNSEIIAARSLPLLMLIVGFFPTSFSLVIALEAFVGEKERKSLEPLLATPLSNTELYLGKLLAAVVPPVLAAFIGISVYALGITLTVGEPIPLQALMLVLIITAVQALLMVSAAVIVSSQTTSVRAANLLASFIIVPVSILLQLEAVLLVFQHYFSLWCMVAALVVLTLIFLRLGIQRFNREQLLGRPLDYLRPGEGIKHFWRVFVGGVAQERVGSLGGWYRSLWGMLPELRYPVRVLWLALGGAVLIGALTALANPLPDSLLGGLRGAQSGEAVTAVQTLLNQLPVFIFTHNLRALLLIALIGTLTFGVGSVLTFMLPWIVIAFVTTQFAVIGENPFVFLGATILPHAWLELPALLLVVGAAVRWQATIISPLDKRRANRPWLTGAAEFTRLLVGFGMPLLLAAALFEAYVTPAVIGWVYG